jgi:hypothetical protein
MSFDAGEWVEGAAVTEPQQPGRDEDVLAPAGGTRRQELGQGSRTTRNLNPVALTRVRLSHSLSGL